MPSVRWVGLSVLAALLAGCSASASPPAPSADIRSADLGGVEWFDSVESTTVKLTGGMSRPQAEMVPSASGFISRMIGPVVYADVDGDGDEDAAAGLQTEGGQRFSSVWHIWLWQDGKAVQVRQPIAEASRCDGAIESVVARPGAFAVSMVIRDVDDPCSTNGSLPVSYEVGVRSGWPVRLRPEFGPVQTCNPRAQAKELTPAGKIQLHTWPDGRSPGIGEPARPGKVFVESLYVGDREDRATKWILVAAEQQDGRRVCGWARYGEVVAATG